MRSNDFDCPLRECVYETIYVAPEKACGEES